MGRSWQLAANPIPKNALEYLLRVSVMPETRSARLEPNVTSYNAATNACERGWSREQHTATGADSRLAV